MRQQDANRTRQRIEDRAGKTYVTQATSYQGGGTGEYSETKSAEVREVAGVDWRDLQSLIEGEAIILFGGRRIYAKLFHADIDTHGPMRLNRPVPLALPDVSALKVSSEQVDGVLKALEQGLGTGKTKRSPTLAAMLKGFSDAAAVGQGGQACIEAAIEAAKTVLWRARTSPRWGRDRRWKPCSRPPPAVPRPPLPPRMRNMRRLKALPRRPSARSKRSRPGPGRRDQRRGRRRRGCLRRVRRLSSRRAPREI